MRMRQIRRRQLHGRTIFIDGKANPVTSTGPGSMRCEADIERLISDGKLGEAHRLAVNHLRECGGDERRIKKKCRPSVIAGLIEERAGL